VVMIRSWIPPLYVRKAKFGCMLMRLGWRNKGFIDLLTPHSELQLN